MRYLEPDFFEDFKCTADKCRYSCCVGWEIDVDEASLRRYSKVDGALGKKLRENISSEGDAHFILGENERCPFLMESGLCQLICDLGEESLCDICSEHPRFYNYYENREERGIGLCCEEAVRLLSSEKALRIIEYDNDGAGEDEAELILRDEILNILSDRAYPLTERRNYSLHRFRSGRGQ